MSVTHDLDARFLPGGWQTIGRVLRRRHLSARGITLSDADIGWTVAGSAHRQRLDDIARIRLRADPRFCCNISFRGGGQLRVGCEPASASYADFVCQLHEHLRLGFQEGPHRSSIKFYYRRREGGAAWWLGAAILGWLGVLLVFGGGGDKLLPYMPGLLVPHPPAARWFAALALADALLAIVGAVGLVATTTRVLYDPAAIPDRLLPAA